MTSVAVLGAGGHGHDIAAIAWAAGWLPEFFDDADDFYLACAESDGGYVVGVNDPATRRRLAVGSAPVTLVHPTATVDPSATLAGGCVVGAGSHLGPRVALGPHTHIGAGCTITRTKVGAYTTISPGVNIAGDVTIGQECLVGVAATISNLVTVGDRCVIGAGAVVVDHVWNDQVVAGVPARPLQRREQR